MTFDLVDRVRRSDDGEALRMLFSEKASRVRMLPAVQARIRAKAALLVPPPKPKPVEASPPPPKPDPITLQAEILKANWQAQSAGTFYAEAWRELARVITVDDIRKEVCRHFNVSKADLDSSCRHAKLVLPRQIAMYLSREMTTRTYPDIGRRFGGRDHTTALHAHRVIPEKMATQPKVREAVEAIIARLKPWETNENKPYGEAEIVGCEPESRVLAGE